MADAILIDSPHRQTHESQTGQSIERPFGQGNKEQMASIRAATSSGRLFCVAKCLLTHGLTHERLPARRLLCVALKRRLPRIAVKFSVGVAMKRKFLISLLSTVGILVVGVGVAYATGTFKANQDGYRQAGEGQAARITMRVEAGTADANSALVPDSNQCGVSNPCPGGALSFSIANTSDLPIRVTQIAEATAPCGLGGQCAVVSSNKNGIGTFAPRNADGTFAGGSGGDCVGYLVFVAPPNFDAWPTIGANSTLQVNGTDNSQLGAGMIHLSSNTPSGCQGATFNVGLIVTATEATQARGFPPLP